MLFLTIVTHVKFARLTSHLQYFNRYILTFHRSLRFENKELNFHLQVFFLNTNTNSKIEIMIVILMEFLAQLNFNSPKFVFTNFRVVLKTILAANFERYLCQGLGYPGRARVRVPPEGLGKWMLNWSGQIFCKNKYCHNVC